MALDIFLTISGIAGESANISFRGSIEVFSYSLGLSNPVTIGSTTGGAGAGKVSFSDLSIMKNVDAASPKLIQACASGEHLAKMTLFLVKSGEASSIKPFLVYDFGEVFVSSVQESGSTGGGDAPSESVSFAYAKFEIQYTSQNPDGSAGTPVTAGYDITKNAAS